MRKILTCFFFISLLALPSLVSAATLLQDKVSTVKARVLDITKQESEDVAGTGARSIVQTVQVEILEGEKEGESVTVENDYIDLKKGEVFYLLITESAEDGRTYYTVQDPYRLPTLYFFVGLFVVCVLIFGGVQGIRGLLSLIGSFLLILYVLIPGVLHGYSPILISIGVSSLIIILGSYVTHGFNRTTTSAVLGMIVTVIFTGILAYFAVKYARLTGFESEEAVYLNFNTGGAIDFVGLLLGGIMIGLLGVLYDVAIGQAIAVEELHAVGPHLPRKMIYKRALRIGREHIGALVNTLAIAYVGASLPLLLLFYTSTSGGYAPVINRGIFAVEIIRTMIGSIGLILAVPITTLLSVFILIKDKSEENQEILKKEEKQIETVGHKH